MWSKIEQITDALYALAMCKEGDNRHSFYTFLKNRENYEDHHPVVIFGCGRWGHFYKKVIEDYKVGKIVAWCDNKTELQRKYIGNTKVSFGAESRV